MDLHTFSPLTACFTNVVLAAGTTTTLSTTNAATYAIKGLLYTQSAAWTNQATPTTDYATSKAFLPVPANYGCVYMVGLDSAKAMKVIQGTVVPLDSAGAFIQASLFGASDAAGSLTSATGFCPIGYVVIKAGSTASSAPGWLFGTNNMSSVTGITYAFGNLASFPGRPLIA